MIFVIRVLCVMACCWMLSGCATGQIGHAFATGDRAWTRGDTVGELLVGATLAIDAYQTNKIRDLPGHREIGFAGQFCGPQPSASCTRNYFATVMISHAVIAWALPQSWRKYWAGIAVTVQAPTIISNWQKQK